MRSVFLSSGIQYPAAPAVYAVVIAAAQVAYDDLAGAGGGVDEVALAEVDADMVGKVAVGYGVEEYQIAALKGGGAGNLLKLIVIAVCVSGTLQGNADLLPLKKKQIHILISLINLRLT